MVKAELGIAACSLLVEPLLERKCSSDPKGIPTRLSDRGRSCAAVKRSRILSDLWTRPAIAFFLLLFDCLLPLRGLQLSPVSTLISRMTDLHIRKL